MTRSVLSPPLRVLIVLAMAMALVPSMVMTFAASLPALSAGAAWMLFSVIFSLSLVNGLALLRGMLTTLDG